MFLNVFIFLTVVSFFVFEGGGGLYFSGVTGLVLFLSGIPVFREKMYGTTVFHLLSMTGNCLIICRYFGIFTLKSRYFGTNYLKIP